MDGWLSDSTQCYVLRDPVSFRAIAFPRPPLLGYAVQWLKLRLDTLSDQVHSC